MLLEQIEGLRTTAGAYEKAMAGIHRMAGEMMASAQKIQEAVSEVQAVAKSPSVAPQPSRPAIATPKPLPIPPRKASSAVAGDSEALSGPERRIVNSIAWFHALGIENPEKAAVAFMAGYTFGSGGFNNPCGALNRKGLIEYLADSRIRLTADGLAMAEPTNVPATNDALHLAVLGRLGGPEQRILIPLLKGYPKGMDNLSLAEASGYAPNSGGYNNPRGRLKSLGLIRYESGTVYANDLLFPERM